MLYLLSTLPERASITVAIAVSISQLFRRRRSFRQNENNRGQYPLFGGGPRHGCRQVMSCGTLILLLLPTAQAGLVLHYTFDTNDGVNTGSAGGGYDAVASGGPSYVAGASPDGSTAVLFDGVDDRFILGNKFSLPQSADWSIAYWVKTNDLSAFGGYAGTPAVPGFGETGVDIWFSAGVDNGVASLNYYDKSANHWVGVSGSEHLADDTFHHLSFVYSNALGELKIFVDGALDVTNAVGVGIIDDSRMGLAEIGASYTPHYASMMADDFRVYDQALTLGEVQTLAMVPEPSTLPVFLCALAGLAFSRRSWRNRPTRSRATA